MTFGVLDFFLKFLARFLPLCPLKVKGDSICIPPGSDYKADGSEPIWKRVVDFPLGWYPSFSNLLVITALASIPPCFICVAMFLLFPVEDASDTMFVVLHLTYFEAITKPAWIVNFYESIRTSLHSTKEAGIAFVFPLLGCKAVDYWFFGVNGKFPIKFSLVQSGFGGLVIANYLFLLKKCPDKQSRAKLEAGISLQRALGFAVFLSGAWAAVMLRFKGAEEKWAVGWCISFTLLKSCLNTFLVTPYAMEAAPDDFPIFPIYSELLLSGIQAATVPLMMTSTVAFWFLLVVDIAGPLFRCFAGVDRLKLFIGWTKRGPIVCKTELGDGWRWKALFHPSVEKVCELILRAHGDAEVRKRRWIDREMYHCISAIGNCSVSIIVRMSQLMLVWLIKWICPQEQVHDRFDGSDSDMQEFSAYEVGRIVAQMFSLVLVHSCVLKKPKMKTKGADQEADFCRIIDYIFRQHFWQIFFWNVTSGSYVVASMVKPFGFSFDSGTTH